MQIELDLADGRRDLVATSDAGHIHRFTLYQTLTRELAEAVAAEPRLSRLLHALEGEPICAAGRCITASPAVVAAVATGLQLLQEYVMQQTQGVAPVFPGDEYARVLTHEGIFADAVEVFGSEGAARAWMGKPAIGLDGQRPVDLLQTAEGTEVVKAFLVRLRFGVYT